MVTLRPLAFVIAAGLGLAVGWPAMTGQPKGFSSSAAPAAPESPAPVRANATPMPHAPVLLALLRSTLAAVNQANVTGNYTVLRDLGAPVFRENYNSAELTDRFRPWRENALDFAAILLLDAKLSRAPAIDANGVLRLTGYFPTAPLRIGFDLGFKAVSGNWKLATISVDARQVDDMTAASSAGAVPAPTASNAQNSPAKASAAEASKASPPAKASSQPKESPQPKVAYTPVSAPAASAAASPPPEKRSVDTSPPPFDMAPSMVSSSRTP